MISRALDLREALDTYAFVLQISEDKLDLKTFHEDYINDNEWKTLALIAEQLEPLFRLTKDIEGNPDRYDLTLSTHGAL
jgi:hypothetical protein